MKMLLTRIGDKSKLIITGDVKQSDIGMENGLSHLLSSLETKYTEPFKMYKEGVGIVQLDSSCIQRHPIIQSVLELSESVCWMITRYATVYLHVT